MRSRRWAAFTLTELMVVIAIIGVLIGLLSPAIQRAREASLRTQCGNNLHQLGLALYMYHDLQGAFPPGLTSPQSGDPHVWTTWLTRILPFLDQEPLWLQTQ